MAAAAGPAGRVCDRRPASATLATWFVHSSLSIVLLVMSFAGSGLIEPRLALALVIGANIGGALAPYMAQSGADVEARRVPLANLITRAIVGLAVLPFLGPVVAVAVADRSVGDAPRGQLPYRLQHRAALVFLPLIDVVAWAVPPPAAGQAGGRRSRPAAPSRPQRARHAAEALGCAMRETLNLGDRVADMLRQTMDVFESNDPKAGEGDRGTPTTRSTGSTRRSSSTSSRPRAPSSARRTASATSRS